MLFFVISTERLLHGVSALGLHGVCCIIYYLIICYLRVGAPPPSFFSQTTNVVRSQLTAVPAEPFSSEYRGYKPCAISWAQTLCSELKVQTVQ